jgi:DnaJ-domain-containing protein 1
MINHGCGAIAGLLADARNPIISSMDRAPHRFHSVMPETHVRACDKSGCVAEGLYRAPKSNRALRDYHWFCLDHVREYNKAWNFCSGMSEAEIEAMVRRDTTWERDTRPMSAWIAHEQRLHAAAADFAGYGHHTEARPKPREPDTPEAAALRLLGLTPPVDYAAIRTRYIALVKINHPDANGGDKEAEERLKAINQALMVLKAAYLT